jgi:hypothetical protein
VDQSAPQLVPMGSLSSIEMVDSVRRRWQAVSWGCDAFAYGVKRRGSKSKVGPTRCGPRPVPAIQYRRVIGVHRCAFQVEVKEHV